jgi:hypothetical protein
MGTAAEPRPVKLLVSLITADDRLMSEAVAILAKRYGEIDFESEDLPFDFTSYYALEMGAGLYRRLVTFGPLIPRESLVRIKGETNELEATFAVNGKRRINIDPGYISAEHLILATTKGYTHRPYLGQGIYADLTLIYRSGEFHPLEWTYPDYASHEMRHILAGIRRRYLSGISKGEKGKGA